MFTWMPSEWFLILYQHLFFLGKHFASASSDPDKTFITSPPPHRWKKLWTQETSKEQDRTSSTIFRLKPEYHQIHGWPHFNTIVYKVQLYFNQELLTSLQRDITQAPVCNWRRLLTWVYLIAGPGEDSDIFPTLPSTSKALPLPA